MNIGAQIIALTTKEIKNLQWLKRAVRKPDDSGFRPEFSEMHRIKNRLIAANGFMMFSIPAPETFKNETEQTQVFDVLTNIGKFTGINVLPESDGRTLAHKQAPNIVPRPDTQICAFAIDKKFLIDALGVGTDQVIVRVFQLPGQEFPTVATVETLMEHLPMYETQQDKDEQNIALVMLCAIPEALVPRKIDMVPTLDEVQK